MNSRLLNALASEELVLWRPTLEDIPEAVPQSGYSLSPFKPGREKDWVKIHELADPGNNPTLALHARQFGTDLSVLTARQFFLLEPGGRVVGTSSAWFCDGGEEGLWGRVHWVAILPEFQGRGLSRILMAHTLRLLRKLGHDRAFLTTDPARSAALRLYERFGFKPWKAPE